MLISIFNKIVVIIVALLVLAAAIITLLVASGVTSPDILSWFKPQLQYVVDATGNNAVAIVAISVVVILGMIAILVLESMPISEPHPLLISSTEEGIVTIDIKSICLLAEKTTAIVHSVQHVKCYTKETAGGLIISCRPSVLLGTNLIELGTQLQSSIKEAIEEFTGLTVGQVDIKIKYEPVEARRLAVR